MGSILDSLSFSFTVTAPIFIVLFLGLYLKHRNFINDEFIDISSKIMFNIALPCLLFFTIVKTPLSEINNIPLIAYGLASTLIIYLSLEWWAKRLEPISDRGVFVQGSFRGNLGFIGLAYCVNAYGDEGLVAASLYIGFLTAMYNILAVFTLNRSMSKEFSPQKISKMLITNPLIMAILLAVLFSSLRIPVPEFAEKAGGYLGNLALPLALLCTGGALNFNELKTNPRKTIYATFCKLILIPLLMILGGFAIGLRGIDLGVLLFMSSAPTATASFVMVKAMGGNYKLAANIIALTTLGSLFTVSVAIVFLRSVHLI